MADNVMLGPDAQVNHTIGMLRGKDAATRADLERISAAWTTWAADPDGWMSMPHGEILARD